MKQQLWHQLSPWSIWAEEAAVRDGGGWCSSSRTSTLISSWAPWVHASKNFTPNQNDLNAIGLLAAQGSTYFAHLTAQLCCFSVVWGFFPKSLYSDNGLPQKTSMQLARCGRMIHYINRTYNLCKKSVCHVPLSWTLYKLYSKTKLLKSDYTVLQQRLRGINNILYKLFYFTLMNYFE